MNSFKKPCKDHKGNKFDSIEEMCRYYGITSAHYRERHKVSGWSLEKSLTEPIHKKCRKRIGSRIKELKEYLRKGIDECKSQCKTSED